MFRFGLDVAPKPTHILNMFRRSSSAGVLARRAGRIAGGSALVVRLIVWLVDPAPRGDALLAASLAIPAAGLALMLPLSLHMIVMKGDFDSWVRMSVTVVGLAHVVFAVLFAARAVGL